MAPLPDPGHLDDLAQRLSRHADAIRAIPDRTRLVLPAAAWSGAAATAFGSHLAGVLDSIAGSAARVEDAAGALRQLAAAWDSVLADLRRAVRDGTALAGAGARLVGDLVDEPTAVPGDAVHLLRDAGAVARDVVGGAAHLIGLG